MKRYNAILESTTEPENKNDLWIKDRKLKIFINGNWESIQGTDIDINEEDLSLGDDDKLELANREYNPNTFSGKGYKILRKNIQNDTNILNQEMFDEENTIYEIRYDFNLNGNTISIPNNCILNFIGGSINNGNIIGNNTNIESISKYSCILNANLSGIWKISEGYPEWFGAKGDGITDDRVPIQTAVNNCDIVYFRNTKYRLGIIYYQAGQQGNLFIGKNVKLFGNNTELILEGKGQIFTKKGYSGYSPVYDEYKVGPIELITENVPYLSNIIKVNDTSKFNVGDTIIIRGEDSRINPDYEECDQWDINVIKQINNDSIELVSPINFNIDISKCNREGGTSRPTINGSIIKIDVTSVVIDGFKFRENQLSNVFDFQYSINIILNNIDVIHKGVASFKHCANITADNIIHKFSASNNINYGTFQLWGVRNCYIGKIIRHDSGIIDNTHTVRVLSSEGANYNIYAELIDFTTDSTITSVISCIHGDNIYINKLRVTCKYLDNVQVTGINTVVKYFEVNAYSRTTNIVKHISNLSPVFLNKSIYNEVLLIYNDIENNIRHYYSFNVNKVVCSKTYVAIDDTSRKIQDDIFSSGSLCLVGASVSTNLENINVKLVSSPEIIIEYIKNSNNQYSNVVSFLYTEESLSKRDFYLSTDKNSEISRDNPLIVTLFFTPLYHLTQVLDGDRTWKIHNGNYSKDVISINKYPYGYLENDSITDYNRRILNKDIGTTSDRPTNASEGFQYFDTTINKPIWWNSNKWVDTNGETVDLLSQGTFLQKPTNSQGTPIGFKYYCTDMKNSEGNLQGVYIYYKGNDVWTTSDGVEVSSIDSLVYRREGTTEERPTSPPNGFVYRDTTINKLIWYFNNIWYDNSGNIV